MTNVRATGTFETYAQEAREEFSKIAAPQTVEQIDNYLAELTVVVA